jgi:hypothetical protein
MQTVDPKSTRSVGAELAQEISRQPFFRFFVALTSVQEVGQAGENIAC